MLTRRPRQMDVVEMRACVIYLIRRSIEVIAAKTNPDSKPVTPFNHSAILWMDGAQLRHPTYSNYSRLYCVSAQISLSRERCAGASSFRSTTRGGRSFPSPPVYATVKCQPAGTKSHPCTTPTPRTLRIQTARRLMALRSPAGRAPICKRRRQHAKPARRLAGDTVHCPLSILRFRNSNFQYPFYLIKSGNIRLSMGIEKYNTNLIGKKYGIK
jgi:hypothetical protein